MTSAIEEDEQQAQPLNDVDEWMARRQPAASVAPSPAPVNDVDEWMAKRAQAPALAPAPPVSPAQPPAQPPAQQAPPAQPSLWEKLTRFGAPAPPQPKPPVPSPVLPPPVAQEPKPSPFGPVAAQLPPQPPPTVYGGPQLGQITPPGPAKTPPIGTMQQSTGYMGVPIPQPHEETEAPAIGPSKVYPVTPLPPLIKSGVPQPTAPVIQEQEQPPDRVPLGPIGIGQPQNLPAITGLAKLPADKQDAVAAIQDLRTLLWGPAYSTALNSDSAV